MARPAGHDSFEPNGELTFISSIWGQKGHTGADYLLLTFTFSSLIAKNVALSRGCKFADASKRVVNVLQEPPLTDVLS